MSAYCPQETELRPQDRGPGRPRAPNPRPPHVNNAFFRRAGRPRTPPAPPDSAARGGRGARTARPRGGRGARTARPLQPERVAAAAPRQPDSFGPHAASVTRARRAPQRAGAVPAAPRAPAPATRSAARCPRRPCDPGGLPCASPPTPRTPSGETSGDPAPAPPGGSQRCGSPGRQPRAPAEGTWALFHAPLPPPPAHSQALRVWPHLTRGRVAGAPRPHPARRTLTWAYTQRNRVGPASRGAAGGGGSSRGSAPAGCGPGRTGSAWTPGRVAGSWHAALLTVPFVRRASARRPSGDRAGRAEPAARPQRRGSWRGAAPPGLRHRGGGLRSPTAPHKGPPHARTYSPPQLLASPRGPCLRCRRVPGPLWASPPRS